MTTPDPDETPQPSRALLSAFLGGWARFQSKDGDKDGDSAADAESGAESSAPDAESGGEPDGRAGVEDVQAAADANDADGSAVSATSATEAASDGGAEIDTGDEADAGDEADSSAADVAAVPDGPGRPDDASSAAADAADTAAAADARADEDGHDNSVDELAELADLDDEDADLDDHVIEVADPRDFADDAGPLYEDEDFDEDFGQEAEVADPDRSSTGQAEAAVDQTAAGTAQEQPTTGAAASADEGAAEQTDSDERVERAEGTESEARAGQAGQAGRADSPASPAASEDDLPPLESFTSRYTDRELTWMDFNERVLEQAEDRDLPLLERAWFLAIFSSNLDEFYMVRVAGLMRRIKAGITPVRASGLDANQVLAEVTRRAKELTARQAALFEEDIRPGLAEHNVDILGWGDLNLQQQERLTRYFRHHIYPVLTPLAVDPSHPFP